MEVAKDFAKRMQAQAEGIPREVIANLLERLMPRKPVTSRPPSSGDLLPPPPIRDAFTGQAMRTRTRRTRRPKATDRPYRVLREFAPNRHRRGTYTHAMVSVVVANMRVKDAELALATQYPEFASKGIDWNWLVEEKQYITFKMED
jgi:hypothetical protein